MEWIALLAAGAPVVVWVVIACFAVCLLVFAVLFQSIFSAWIQLWASGTPVTVAHLVGMRLRRVPLRTVAEACVRLHLAGLDFDLRAIEQHHLAGGDVRRVAEWVVAAQAAGLAVTWEELAQADLAHRLPDVAELGGQDAEAFASALQDSERHPGGG